MPHSPQATKTPACSAAIKAAPPAPTSPLLTVLALALVALNLRPALSSLSTVLPEVMQTLGIGATTASLLTMAPVLCLGLFGFITPRLDARFGSERTVIGALLVLTTGIALRSIPAFPGLFIGTVLAGAGIGVAGVLLPSLVKRDFPRQASLMTGVYTMALCAGAAAAAGLTVPLADWLGGWPGGLAFWALPALAAVLFWLPQIRQQRPAAPPAMGRHLQGLWRDRLAWQVTLFMGLQSSLAYIVFGWLAPILRERGLDPVAAGLAVSISILVQVPAALGAPVLATRRSAQSGAVVAVTMLILIGLLGCLYAPLPTLWFWVVLLGIAQGSSFAIALSLIVLRAPDPRLATHLSSMAQSVGYTLASCGPLLAGLIRDWTGSWDAAGPLFVVICCLAAAIGFGAGRDRYVLAPPSIPASPQDSGRPL